MSTRTLAKALASGSGVTVGQYTGDGGATQAITGVGFKPKMVWIYPMSAPGGGWDTYGFYWTVKTDLDGLNAVVMSNDGVGGLAYTIETDQIISLDADGFTVGDGTGGHYGGGITMLNIVAQIYTYVCWRS